MCWRIQFELSDATAEQIGNQDQYPASTAGSTLFVQDIIVQTRRTITETRILPRFSQHTAHSSASRALCCGLTSLVINLVRIALSII